MMGASDRQRLCVITPYFKEDRDLLERCLISVRNQTVSADHIFVADGFPQDWLDQEPVRHVKLDRAHADYGNVARGIASLMAVSEKYDGIAFLDADNWFDDDHLATCLEASASNPMAPYVIAQRNFARPDGSIMPIKSTEDFPNGDHVDTNCYFFLPSSYHLLHFWCTMPRELSTHGDRLFRNILRIHTSIEPALTSKFTVNYSCLFQGFYTYLGEEPPAGAKPNVDWRVCMDWLKTLSAQELTLVDHMSGLALSRLVRSGA